MIGIEALLRVPPASAVSVCRTAGSRSDRVDPGPELGAVHELLAKRVARACAARQLADPEVDAGEVATAAQEGVVEVRDVRGVVTPAVGVLAAVREGCGDRLDFGLD